MQHILCRIVVHVSHRLDIEVRRCRLKFLRRQHRSGLIARPCKVVAVVVQRVIRILRRIEPAACAVAQPLVHPAQDVLRHPCELRLDKALERMRVVLQKLAVVIRHLLEVRHDPPLIHRIAMKATRQLVIDAALSHLLQRDYRHSLRRCDQLSAAHRAIDQEIQRSRMRELRLRSEASIAIIELLHCRLDQLVQQGNTQIAATRREALVVFNGAQHTAR